MIERRRLPRNRRVTGLTVLTEIACDVIRVRCSGKIRGMALIAARIDELVIAIDVARLTWRRYVRAGQCELCRTVIECRRFPNIRRVTCLASVTESCCHVVWIRGFREISGVT